MFSINRMKHPKAYADSYAANFTFNTNIWMTAYSISMTNAEKAPEYTWNLFILGKFVYWATATQLWALKILKIKATLRAGVWH